MNSLLKLFNKNLILSAERTAQISSQSRFLSCTAVGLKGSSTTQILRNLNIPERPKRPLTAYLRFVKEYRASQPADNGRQAVVNAASEWNKLNDGQKQRYSQAFQKEKTEYDVKIKAYENSLTKDQKLAIKNERNRLKELKEKRSKVQELKNLSIENGKPKRSPGAFLLFFSDEARKAKTNVKDAKVKFEALGESQKNAYAQKAVALREEYKKSLAAWEKQMISKGLTALVRKETIRAAKAATKKTKITT